MPRPPIRNRPSSSMTSERPAHLPHPSAPFHPLADTTTYKDLLLFEERLKMNAQMLNRRRRRYEAFLVTLVISIVFLAHRAMFKPSELHLVRYLTKGLLAVALVTLVLFFASGMYQERIAYANKYVPHANRALRGINMHLNMRRGYGYGYAGLGNGKGIAGRLRGWVGRGRRSGEGGTEGEKERLVGGNGVGVGTRSNSSIIPPSTNTTTAISPTPPSSSSSTSVIPPIPPTQNPRGELIFSSRIPPHFKEGYERYRAAFERRRGEKIREERWRRSWFFVRWFLEMPEGLANGGGTGKGGAGTVAGVSQGQGRKGGSLGVRMDGGGQQRSRSHSPAINSTTSTTLSSASNANPTMTTMNKEGVRPGGPKRVGSEPLASRSANGVRTEVSDEEKAGIHDDDEKAATTARMNRDRSESYTFILGKGEVDKHTMTSGRGGGGAGIGTGQREVMARLDEEKQ
ncbi:hypothetical protein FFLO_03645 [Filobasidium floriforme]|uniref:Transmembrane protein 188 n=1 Tax=Filobasidium floriforme TaxID=5210 RepID=A0A8K0NN29_9TREE|nr:hypothetical protein FFLO_03645 [Filobasidium floriforme]